MNQLELARRDWVARCALCGFLWASEPTSSMPRFGHALNRGGSQRGSCSANQGCGKCAGLQRWLARVGLSFVVRAVLTDPDAAQQVTDLGLAMLPATLTPDGRAAAERTLRP